MPNPLNVPITPPRVAFIDPRTGNVSREWYLFFLSLFQTSGGSTVSLDDVQKGPPMLTVDEINVIVDKASENLHPSTESVIEQIAELRKQIEALETQVRPELGTMSQLQQANVPWQTFNTTAEGVPPDIGTVAWDGGTTLGIQMTANVLQRVGECEYVYVKASSAITKGQLCYHTGAVGASGVITAAPTPLNLADPNQIVGVAAETIAINGFGLIQISGDLRGFNTTGSSVGETWADGDPLYYNPAYVGSMTKVKPSAPNQKTYIGEVINAGNAGNGSMHIRIVPGSVLGGTDSNVQFGTLANNDLIQYDSALGYWKNVSSSSIAVGTATNLAGGVAGSVPYQTAANTTTFRAVGTAGQVFRVNSGATAPEWVSPAALTKTDDTNVTLTLGGTPATSLLAATSLTLGWAGQLSVARGGTGVATTPSNGQLLIGNGTGYTVANLTAGSGVTISNSSGGISISATGTGGTVTSVGLSAPTGFDVSGSPVTGSGTLALSFASGYSLPTTASQANWDTAFSERRQWDGGSTSLVAATGRTSLGGTTVGQNLFTLTNPSAITFLRVNADNTVSTLDAATFRTAIGAGTGNGSVTSVNASGGTTGLTFSGGPITSSGTLTLAGTLAVSNGGTGQIAFGINRIPFINSSGAFADASNLTYNGTTFGVTGKASYLNPTLGTGGFNILASYTYNNSSTNTIGGSGTFNQSCFIIHINTGTGMTSIPVYTNGGAGVAWNYVYLDPDAATWTVSGASPTITFTVAGTGGSTFQVQLNSGNGSGTITRTAGANGYTVYIQMLATF